jgi:hypothetical protein
MVRISLSSYAADEKQLSDFFGWRIKGAKIVKMLK